MKKILIIDDSTSIRNLIKHALSEINDLEIVEAENGFEGLEEIKSHNFDVVLCDCDMPVMGGIETISKTRKTLYKSTPFIGLATKAELDKYNLMTQAGAESILIKPLSPKEIKSEVSEYVL
ncbi:response regulator [Pseudoalteromonas marina]|uniref:Response regulator n=1 Tax=Pseudoalteromonas marina TaxID=267375 RepID=A0ABT9FC23_9GAMM|nr:response regulator [Pseudoalteromonas marina]MDP2564315.1 response regulator [Pseudoalteromonas marina]